MRTCLAALPLLLALSACGDKPEPVAPAPVAAPAPAAVQPAGEASPAVAAPSGPVSTGDHAPAANFGKLKYTGNCLGCHGHAGKGQGVFPGSRACRRRSWPPSSRITGPARRWDRKAPP